MTDEEFEERCRNKHIDDRDEAEFLRWLAEKAKQNAKESK